MLNAGGAPPDLIETVHIGIHVECPLGKRLHPRRHLPAVSRILTQFHDARGREIDRGVWDNKLAAGGLLGQHLGDSEAPSKHTSGIPRRTASMATLGNGSRRELRRKISASSYTRSSRETSSSMTKFP